MKNHLKHKRKEMSIENLIVKLFIEKDSRGSDNQGVYQYEAKANVMEDGQSFKVKKKPNNKGSKLRPKGGISKKKRF